MPFVFLYSTLEGRLQLVSLRPQEALGYVSFLDLPADGALETCFVGWPPSKVPSYSVVFCFEKVLMKHGLVLNVECSMCYVVSLCSMQYVLCSMKPSNFSSPWGHHLPRVGIRGMHHNFQVLKSEHNV